MLTFEFPRHVVPVDRLTEATEIERRVNEQARVYRAKGYTRKRAHHAAITSSKIEIERFWNSLPYTQRVQEVEQAVQAAQEQPAADI